MEHTVQILVAELAHGMVELTRAFHLTRIQEAHPGHAIILVILSSPVAIHLVIHSAQKTIDGDN